MPSGAQACELSYHEAWKIWRGECALTIDTKGPQLLNEVVVARTTLKLPDLLIDKLKFRLFGDQLEVYADITNTGTGSSPATTVVLNTSVFDPASPAVVATRALGPATVPALASMATQRVFMGTLTTDHSIHDVDVLVNGMVDPITSAQPMRGMVFELVESNNSVMHLCRVFGPLPNQAVQACN
jgi:hypothetical protein